MPINGEQCASFIGIKGENCSFLNISGVRSLRDDKGNDLLSMIKGGSGVGSFSSSSSDVNTSNIMGRLDAIEKFLQNMPIQQSSQILPAVKDDSLEKKLMARITALEKIIQDFPVPEAGPPGPQGPRGTPGAKSIQEMTDVNLDGLDDNAILIWSAKQKKWVISIEE